jgi:hypothetical protein
MAALGDVRTQDTTATKLVRAVPLALPSGSAIAGVAHSFDFPANRVCAEELICAADARSDCIRHVVAATGWRSVGSSAAGAITQKDLPR